MDVPGSLADVAAEAWERVVAVVRATLPAVTETDGTALSCRSAAA